MSITEANFFVLLSICFVSTGVYIYYKSRPPHQTDRKNIRDYAAFASVLVFCGLGLFFFTLQSGTFGY